ncbi:echinoidin-like [Amphiura filiformis]|uniref:echinoidin-like n=1 Tax=Amphiura filiformis TaxID=82378 RepID=UPI003B216612
MFLLAVLLVNTLFLSGTFADHGTGQCHRQCPPFWTRFQDNCYRFFGSVKNWANAEAHCNEFFTDTAQGHLVSIHSKTESDFVYKLWHDSLLVSSQLLCTFSGNTGASPLVTIHLGLTDAAVEGVFVWTDGSPTDYNEWGLNQPDNVAAGVGEDCTKWIDESVNVSFKPWNDLRCDSVVLSPYVCMLKLDDN